MGAPPWKSHTWTGSATDFHSVDLPFERGIWLCRPIAPALILGSSQPESDVDRAKAAGRGIEVARRRSGGGAVFVHPDDSVWIDIMIPRDDLLWVDDVGRSMLWLGRAWVDALVRAAGASNLAVHSGPFEPGERGATICFASASPGEVFDRIGRDDRAKVVGISQRRSREGARFQCIAYRAWRPELWADLLTSPDAGRAARSVRVEITSAPATEVALGLHRILNSDHLGAAKTGDVPGGEGEHQGVGGG